MFSVSLAKIKGIFSDEIAQQCSLSKLEEGSKLLLISLKISLILLKLKRDCGILEVAKTIGLSSVWQTSRLSGIIIDARKRFQDFLAEQNFWKGGPWLSDFDSGYYCKENAENPWRQ